MRNVRQKLFISRWLLGTCSRDYVREGRSGQEMAAWIGAISAPSPRTGSKAADFKHRVECVYQSVIDDRGRVFGRLSCRNFLKYDHYYRPVDWRLWEKDPGWFIIIVFVMVCCACSVSGIMHKVMEGFFGSSVLPNKYYFAMSIIITFSWVGSCAILLKKLSHFLQERRLLNALFSGPLHTWPFVQ